MPLLKNTTCIVFVSFLQHILLSCDLMMISRKTQTGGFSYGVTHYQREGPSCWLSASLASQTRLLAGCGVSPWPNSHACTSRVSYFLPSHQQTFVDSSLTLGQNFLNLGRLEGNFLLIWKPQSYRYSGSTLCCWVSKETIAICDSVWSSRSNSYLLWQDWQCHDSFERLSFPQREIL